MKILAELILYCLLFFVMVKYAVRNGAADALYFYPEAVRKRAIAIGLSTEEEISRRRKEFMPLFFAVMTAALVVIIRYVNGIRDFKNAYLQSLLFLEVMNWFDGIVIDRLWVGHDPFWKLKGCEDVPYVQTWPQVIRKRCILTLIWIAGACISAGIVILLP